MATKTKAKSYYAGRPYGHVPGHHYLDADLCVTARCASITITWGSAQGQGCDEEHGRVEYSARTVEGVRARALAEELDSETRALVETVCAEALRGE